MGCFSFLLLGIFYFVTDVKGWWGGQPFVYPGAAYSQIKGGQCRTDDASMSPFLTEAVLLRDELHLRVRWPLSPGFLLPVQLGDALPGQSLGGALPKPVGNCSVGAHCLLSLQEEILPQNMSNHRLTPFSADAIIPFFPPIESKHYSCWGI